jgi:glycosyltransferase involved in cell wall biosynthesis
MSPKNPKVSVAMATYNGAGYLSAQIESILNQSIKPFELVVSDDGSSDDTIAIVESFSQKNPEVKIIQNTSRRGFVKNFERAILECTGDFICLAYQDDVWRADKISTLVKEIGDCALIHSDAVLINAQGIIISNSFSRSSFKCLQPKNDLDLILNGYVTGCTSMMRRDFFESIGEFSNELDFHDRFLGFMARKRGGVRYTVEPLTLYRQHNSNTVGAMALRSNITKKVFGYIFSRNLMNPNPAHKKIYEQHRSFFTIISPYIDSDLKYKLKHFDNFFDFCLTGRGFPLKAFVNIFEHFAISKPPILRFLLLLRIIKDSKFLLWRSQV